MIIISFFLIFRYYVIHKISKRNKSQFIMLYIILPPIHIIYITKLFANILMIYIIHYNHIGHLLNATLPHDSMQFLNVSIL